MEIVSIVLGYALLSHSIEIKIVDMLEGTPDLMHTS